VDRAVIATASELFDARHYPSVVAVCTDALDAEPECVPLLVLRARAHLALRRDLDAQADLRDIIRLDPRCGLAYRLLGELAARRDENDSAAIFFREALRLAPDDHEARDWLAIVDASVRPAAAATFPAPAAAAGRFRRTRVLPSPPSAGQPQFARGTQPPAHDAAPLPPPPNEIAPRGARMPASTKEPAPYLRIPNPPAVPSPAGAMPRAATPELPGFGEYLVSTGILTRERLRAAQAYQRSTKVQLATSIVTLGLASPQRIAWAAVAHQSQLARDRQ
jgi:tetratricopeptide (TPR) repeat protein